MKCRLHENKSKMQREWKEVSKSGKSIKTSQVLKIVGQILLFKDFRN